MSELAGQEVVKKTGARVMRMAISGEIDRDAFAQLADLLGRLSASGVAKVVIDFSEVSHFDYRGVRPLARQAEVFRDLGGDLRLSGLSPYVFAIFRSAGAHDAFDYFASVDDAAASFNRSIFVSLG